MNRSDRTSRPKADAPIRAAPRTMGRRLDRILEAEGDTVNRYQASKRADVLMLGCLFRPDDLRGLFHRLGHDLDEQIWRRTVDYYLQRTSHGSTLSGLVHGWVLARARRADAWTFCREAIEGDIADLQGGTTGEGIHLGAMAGTLDLVQRGLTGLETGSGALRLDPVPLPELSEYSVALRYRGHWGVRLRMRPRTARRQRPSLRLRADLHRDPRPGGLSRAGGVVSADPAGSLIPGFAPPS